MKGLRRCILILAVSHHRAVPGSKLKALNEMGLRLGTAEACNLIVGLAGAGAKRVKSPVFADRHYIPSRTADYICAR